MTSNFDAALHPRVSNGQFTERRNDDPTSALSAPVDDLEAELAAYEEPREVDLAEAEERQLVDVRNDALPARLSDEDARARLDPERIERAARVIAKLKAPGRMHLDGVAHPNDEHFDRIWAGEAMGHSEADTQLELERLRQLKAGLDGGTIRPRDIIGTGYRGNTRKIASDYLDGALRREQETLATRGRSSSVNASNVDYARRTAAQTSQDHNA